MDAKCAAEVMAERQRCVDCIALEYRRALDMETQRLLGRIMGLLLLGHSPDGNVNQPGTEQQQGEVRGDVLSAKETDQDSQACPSPTKT